MPALSECEVTSPESRIYESPISRSSSLPLSARTIQHLQQQQTHDGVRRVFQYDAGQVAEHVPAYGRYVKQQVVRLGRDHPLIKAQY